LPVIPRHGDRFVFFAGVAGYAVQFRFEKWAQDHRLSPGLSVDLECIIEGDGAYVL